MKVAVLGLGRTARAVTAYLSRKGCAVTMWGRNSDVVRKLSDTGLLVSGHCAGHYHPRVVDDIAQAVAGADLILVMTVASGHAPVANRLKGLLEAGQRILIFNGNWGAYTFYRVLREEAAQKRLQIGETGAQLFLADYEGEYCHIKSIKKRISLATVRPEDAKDMCLWLMPLFPQFVAEENVVCTSVNSSNPVMHTPIVLFNVTRMENGEEFYFYAQAATRRVLDAVEKIDTERCAVAKAMGIPGVHCVDILNSFWPEQYETLYDAVKNNNAYLTGKGPKTLEHRYLQEDLPFGIAPIAGLGKIYGVSTPHIDAMLACYRWLMDVDYESLAPEFDMEILKELINK